MGLYSIRLMKFQWAPGAPWSFVRKTNGDSGGVTACSESYEKVNTAPPSRQPATHWSLFKAPIGFLLIINDWSAVFPSLSLLLCARVPLLPPLLTSLHAECGAFCLKGQSERANESRTQQPCCPECHGHSLHRAPEGGAPRTRFQADSVFPLYVSSSFLK